MTPNRPLRRMVFFIGGYDPKSPDAFFSRMDAEIERFDALWGASTLRSPVQHIDDDISAVRITSNGRSDGREWRGETDFHFLCLDRAIAPDFALGLPERLQRYSRAFGDFVKTGVLWRILCVSRRYGLFLLYPVVAIIAMVLAGLLAGGLLAKLIGFAAIIPGMAVFLALFLWFGRRWPLNQLMDLCSFVSAWARQQRPREAALTQRFAALIVERVAKTPADEVLLVGHSAGGMLILDAAARCLDLDPEFATRSPRTTILTIGSIALQAGLHPSAQNFRAQLGRLAQAPGVTWADVQCRIDPVNFFHDNPAGLMGVAARENLPLIRHIKVREMIGPKVYRRMRYNVFRIHYQFVLANTLPFWYDFYLILCGPTLLLERAQTWQVGPFPSDSDAGPNAQTG